MKNAKKTNDFIDDIVFLKDEAGYTYEEIAMWLAAEKAHLISPSTVRYAHQRWHQKEIMRKKGFLND
ncbi:hypothetical protein Q4R69_18835 [Morganella morganii subsp. sibonii]|uniref:hypothetical protein n=1 Tax=Morganella morganii TaxID=582 RepID=UPI00046AE89C|nr:hypothetical protein [Morganella morganii]HED3891533.1 hypothetical protein [Morganella morganii]